MGDRLRMDQAASMFFDHFGLLPEKPDVDSLHELVSHFSNIPWENLTKFLVKAQHLPKENRLRLSDTVITEHIEKGTGGTCFSLTEALGAILSSAGYQCHPVMADMNHGRNIHCALLVTSGDGTEFLADPGYLVPEPVLMRPGKVSHLEIDGQTLLWESRVDGKTFDLFTVNGDVKQWKYCIRMNPVGSDEFRYHWQKSFDATGMNSLHLNCRTEDGRLSAHNLNLRRVVSSGKSNEKLGGDYSGKIKAYFGLDSGIAEAAEKEWIRSCQNR